MSKVTITVEDGASHSVRVARTSTTTGQDFDSVELAAGKEQTFEIGDEEKVTILQGAPTPEEEAVDDTAKKK